jgi:hypothetical protein
MGADSSIPLRELWDSNSKFDVINKIASQKSKELAFYSLEERIEKTVARYKLKFSLSAPEKELLKKYSAIRNSIIHNQSHFDIALNERGEVQVGAISCPRHPVSVSQAEINDAVDLFKDISINLGKCIIVDILKGDSHKFDEAFKPMKDINARQYLKTVYKDVPAVSGN